MTRFHAALAGFAFPIVMRRRIFTGFACFAFALLGAMLASGCRDRTAPPPDDAVSAVFWKEVGRWSGHGNVQTGVFTSDSGGFRVHWTIGNETRKDAGRLRVVLRSQDSGREIVEAVDARGAGSGVEEIAAERPRWYYLSIDSSDADWAVSVDERIDAQRRD
jgi:hypothetical protein